MRAIFVVLTGILFTLLSIQTVSLTQDQLPNSISTLLDIHSKLCSDIESLQNQLNQIQSESEYKDLHTMTVDEAQKRLEKVNKTIDEAKKNMENARNQGNKDTIATYDAQLEMAEVEKEKLQWTIDKKNDLDLRIKNIQENLSEKNRKRDAIMFQINGLLQRDTEALQDNFPSLRDMRSKLDTEIEEFQDELSRLNSEIRFLPQAKDLEAYLKQDEKEIERCNRDIETAKERDNVEYIQSRLTTAELGKTRNQQDLIKRKEIDSKIPLLKTILSAKQQSKAKIETKINDLLQRDIIAQGFKQQVSIIFAGLVGGVIIGFFVVACVDERVRKTIFSGTAGIQFITLFSLIIAIILFGVIDILKDKELSALLGGLSGYILGRAMHSESSDSKNEDVR